MFLFIQAQVLSHKVLSYQMKCLIRVNWGYFSSHGFWDLLLDHEGWWSTFFLVGFWVCLFFKPYLSSMETWRIFKTFGFCWWKRFINEEYQIPIGIELNSEKCRFSAFTVACLSACWLSERHFDKSSKQWNWDVSWKTSHRLQIRTWSLAHCGSFTKNLESYVDKMLYHVVMSTLDQC